MTTTHDNGRSPAVACTDSSSADPSLAAHRSLIASLLPAAAAEPWRRPTSRSFRDASPMRPAAALPGATVTATSEQTGLAQTSVTDDTGGYVFVSLTAGSYALRVELTGFKPVERINVVLDAASRRSADFQLEVGAITETISIAAVTSQVETQSGDVSRVITGEQVNNIALNGRNYAQLLQLLPGAVATSTNPFGIGLSTTGQAINGVRSPSTYFMVDGADNMDNGANGNAITQPSLDTISEIKVLTASYSAEFGGRAGALINVVTKGGTREFRGSAYEFLRDEKFDARSYFDQGAPAPLAFNNAGYTIGGPIALGGFNADRSKLFFFFGQDWKKNHQGVSQVTTVPTVAERNGDFRNSSLAAPRDPLTGQPFADRTIPSSRFSANGAGAPRRVSRAELHRPRRQLRHDRHESDRQPRRGRAPRLRALVAHADQLSLLAQRASTSSIPSRAATPASSPASARVRAGRRSAACSRRCRTRC